MAEPVAGPPESGAIDFARLREEVEAATMLPDFDKVARRARRRRARAKLATISAALLIAVILGPAGVVADIQRNDQGTTSGLGPVQPMIDGTPTGGPDVSVTVAAAAGVDLKHTYALLDVCVGDACNLQIFRLSGGSATNRPVRDRLLRSTPDAWLESVSLTALSATTLLVGGLSDDSQWEYQEIDLAGDDGPLAGSGSPEVTTADRAVQLTHFGPIQAIQAHTGRPLSLPSQPPVVQPAVVESVAPGKGIWVIGQDKITGQLAVSVSHDAGRSWTTPLLGIAGSAVSDFDQPVFATYNGTMAYLLTRLSDGEFAFFATSDGGRSWQRENRSPPWPQPVPTGARYGLVVRPDGSLLAWLAGSPTTTYLESTNAGQQFRVTSNGPGGAVYAVPDGYVEVGDRMALSRDAANWATTSVSYAVPGG